jgi:hypothetical protein
VRMNSSCLCKRANKHCSNLVRLPQPWLGKAITLTFRWDVRTGPGQTHATTRVAPRDPTGLTSIIGPMADKGAGIFNQFATFPVAQ